MTLSTVLGFAGIALIFAGPVAYLRDDKRLAYGLYAVGFYLWWKNRRNGRWKRAARELGEKSKARVQALVEQMTPSPIPSPVGGAS